MEFAQNGECGRAIAVALGQFPSHHQPDMTSTTAPVSLHEIMDEAFAQSIAERDRSLGYDPRDYQGCSGSDIPGYDPRDFEDAVGSGIPGYDPRDFEDAAYRNPGYNEREFADVDYSFEVLAADMDYALALSLHEAELPDAASDYDRLVAIEAESSDFEDDFEADEEDDQPFDFRLAARDATKPKRKKRIGARMQKDPRRAYSAEKIAQEAKQIMALKGTEEDMETLTTFLSTQKSSLTIAADGASYFKSTADVAEDEHLLYILGTESDMQTLLAYVMTQVEAVVIMSVKDIPGVPTAAPLG
ncbi:hypothetical protein ACHHYP_13442 [Achlya hypogyna]|uniref:Uncharacterized protein n=1 Tax=Achlya hypogyna TaxID=1202772 RepID=A0A1V9YF72_ACHHY|nr:hypothetical protein ACHHYP_13442 [Achlya hypogyna]